MTALLEIDQLTRRFGRHLAVDRISFAVPRGEVLGFLGPNGAGKTTTMRMITGFLAPTAGRIRVAGFDVAGQPLEARRRIGYLPEGAPAYGEMTPAGILAFTAAVRGLAPERRRARTAEVVERLHLGPVLHQRIETLSKGFKRRVGLALALLHDPEVLILDEPTDGLDPNQKHEVRTLLAGLAADKAIVVSTHILEEVDALCSRAIVIARGKIVADGHPELLLTRSMWNNAVTVRLPADQAPILRGWVERLDPVRHVRVSAVAQGEAELTAFPEEGARILDQMHEAIADTGIEVREIWTERGRLDDVFRDLTRAA